MRSASSRRRSRYTSKSSRALVAGAGVALLAIGAGGAGGQEHHDHHDRVHAAENDHGMSAATAAPVLGSAGESAFGAIAEVVAALGAQGEEVDWSAVDVDALREHLVDMSRVMLAADVATEPVVRGLLVHVTGDEERTVEAIRRMVPAHSRMMQGENGWAIDVTEIPAGVEVQIAVDGEPESPQHVAAVARLRGLGFFGFLASGDHHRRHHWMIATGSPMAF